VTGNATIHSLQLGMEWFPEKPGGLNRMFFELVRHLPAAGVSVRGLVAGSARAAEETGGIVRAFAPASRPLPARLLAVRRAASPLLRDNPGLLVASHLALYTAPVLSRLRQHPLVVHFHGPWALEGRVEHESLLTVFAKAAVERAVYRRATACIALSTPFARYVEQRFGVPGDRIHVVPGGVDASRYAAGASRAEARTRLGWPVDRPIVLAVRRLTRRMGLDDLISAAARVRKRVPELLVLIAGSGPAAGALERWIRELGLERHVRLLGAVPEADLPYAYRAADLSVVPTIALEGFGLIVAESLAAGTPCLVTPVGGLPETVRELSVDLVLPDAGTDALAAGITAALHGSLRLPDARACAEFARSRYDWPVVAERVRRVYEAALR
jgi:glycosyltransferase involved in cell wall biosynthesis